MSHGVACLDCGHFEGDHDPVSGKCNAHWKDQTCQCEQLALPPDADEQREFSRLMKDQGW